MPRDATPRHAAHRQTEPRNAIACQFNDQELVTTFPITMDTAEAPPRPLPSGVFADIPDRRISHNTCSLYGYETARFRGQPAHLAHINNKRGSPSATQVRIIPKQFEWVNSPNRTQLFGQHLGCGGHLIITEGAIDAMSIHEAYAKPRSGVVVSITSEVHDCIDNIKTNLLYVGEFDRVTVFFDSDYSGKHWALQVAKLIGRKACVVVNFGYKDANEAWVAFDGEAIQDAIDKAVTSPFW